MIGMLQIRASLRSSKNIILTSRCNTCQLSSSKIQFIDGPHTQVNQKNLPTSPFFHTNLFHVAELGKLQHQTFFYSNWHQTGKGVKLQHDTIVYTYNGDTTIRILAMFGVVTFIWCMVAASNWKKQKSLHITAPENSRRKQLLDFQNLHRNKFFIFSTGFGITVLLLTLMYPHRVIKQLTLLKGGNKLKVKTYSYLGLSKEFSVPLENISCTQSRRSKGKTISLKVKGKPLSFQIDNYTGIFHNTELFDYVIGLERNLK